MAQLTAREILDKLVSFPTVSRDSNLDLIDWVEDYLNGFGIKAHRAYNEEGTKASLYAQIGPEGPGGVMLSGHVDVVPVDGQAWDTDPFQVVEKDGKLYGRGCCDMKGFDALALAAVPLALERGIKRPLQIALSRDEEVGVIGTAPMLRHMAETGFAMPREVIVGEPSMMKVVTAHKGNIGTRTHMHGVEVHSSILHTGVSAVMEAAKLIDWVNQVNAQSAAQTPSAVGAQFDPPWTSGHVGMIDGGTANNITAKDCHFTVIFRVLPDEDPSDWTARYEAQAREVEKAMKAIDPRAGISLSPAVNVPPLRPETDGAAEAFLRRLTGDNSVNVVSYATEGGHFQNAGLSVAVCGPGDIAQAHQPNEFMTVTQFQKGEAFMQRLVDSLASDG
ncbi:MAG: acetylornithine deacetylase [Mangrovicoccus sp.]